jgi:Putative beta-barrel porin-2, OmpL-like. bbp2
VIRPHSTNPADNRFWEILMNRFAVSVLAASVTAALSGTAFAADKAPTLGDVLKASEINVTGYVDGTYTNFSTDGNSTNYHAYTGEKDSFNVQAADVAVSYLPASGVGGLVELQWGRDVLFNKSSPNGTHADNVLQGYLQYANGPASLMVGKFTTLAGAEVAQESGNTNVSRSLLYTLAIPVTHTGARLVVAPTDTFKITAGVNNGWDRIETKTGSCTGSGGNSCPSASTAELGVSLTPIKMLSLSVAAYQGKEPSAAGAGGTGTIGQRNLVDVVATVNATDALSFVVNYDTGEQKEALADNSKAKWDGVALYANYQIAEAWRVSVRGEQFNDKNCFRTGCAFDSQKLKEGTATVGYAVTKSAELRAEVRQDKSDRDVFTKGGTATDKQTFYGVEAVLKF